MKLLLCAFSGGLAVLVASSGFAMPAFEGNKLVSVYGGVDLQYGHVEQRHAFSLGQQNNNTTSVDSNAHLLYYQEVKDGVFIGADLAIKTLYHSEYTGSYKSAHDGLDVPVEDIHDNGAYLFLKSDKYGIFEFGFATVAESALDIGSNTISVASGGVAGDWTNYANLRGSSLVHHGAGYDPNHSVFWTKPRLYNQYVGVDSLLFSYYSPKISGFEMAFSYLPQGGDNLRNSVSGGVKYENKDLGCSISLISEYLPATLSDNQMVAWAVGASYAYDKFSGAMSCGNVYMGDHTPNLSALDLGVLGRDESAKPISYWDAGLAYAVSSWKASITYLASGSDGYKLSAAAFGVENFILPKFSYYAEVIGFKTVEPMVAGNSGFVFLSGLKLGF